MPKKEQPRKEQPVKSVTGKFVKIGRRYVRDSRVQGMNILTHSNGLFTFSVQGDFGVLTSEETFDSEEKCCARIEALLGEIEE